MMDGTSTSNLDEPKPLANEKSTILGVVITCMILSWGCVIGRLYTRSRIIKSPGIDDVFLVLYLLTTTAGTIAACLSAQYGLGQHYILLTSEAQMAYHQTFYTMNAAYITSTAFIKLALLCQFLRVFSRGTAVWTICLIMAVFTALWGFAYSFIAWVPCMPVQGFWNQDIDAHCYGYGTGREADITEFVATFESHSAVNMTLDILILFLPMPLLFNKDTSRHQRIRLVGLLLMGSIVIFLAIWRLESIIRTQAATYPVRDPTWYAPLSVLLSVLEVDAAAMCASVPIFWPVLTEQWDKMFVTVTREVHITSDSRYDVVHDHYRSSADDDGDMAEEQRGHSRMGSEAELKRLESGSGRRKNTGAHYQDSYVLSSVDPLRAPMDSPRAEARVRSDSMKTSSRRYSTRFLQL